jgi:hypothetical protein
MGIVAYEVNTTRTSVVFVVILRWFAARAANHRKITTVGGCR